MANNASLQEIHHIGPGIQPEPIVPDYGPTKILVCCLKFKF